MAVVPLGRLAHGITMLGLARLECPHESTRGGVQVTLAPLQKRITQAAWDAFSWMVAVPIAVLVRYDFTPPESALGLAALVGLLAAGAYLTVGAGLRLYQGRYVVGTFDEVLGVAVAVALVGGAGLLITLLAPSGQLPRSSFVIASGIAMFLMLGARFMWRSRRTSYALKQSGVRTLIFGAGDAGQQLASLMINDKSGEFQPIGFIDDDPAKRHLRRFGIDVLGTSNELEAITRATRPDVLLVAIAGISAERLAQVEEQCQALGLDARVIPTASEIVGGRLTLADIAEVSDEDLLGRRPISTEEDRITDFIRDRIVLITGAGGSIGSELARQVQRYRPARLILLDRDESALHSVQLTLDGSGTLTSDDLVLADIRDGDRIDEIFQANQPDIVFHTAALKHLPLLERSPSEAAKTNVLGTLNVLCSAMNCSVTTFVNISTDKAADPSSVLGRSKLLTERLTSGIQPESDARYVSVRFGNVLGSRGSVLHTFRYQIDHGGPVTVTDERVTRFFMTIGEAVHLVLQASVIGQHGETLVLDMGQAVKISDVARSLIQRSGKSVRIEYTGLRPGEKMNEVLLGTGEQSDRPLHPLISHTSVDPIQGDSVARLSLNDLEAYLSGDNNSFS